MMISACGSNKLTSLSPAPVHGENLRTIAEFDIAAGEEIPFSLTWSPSYRPVPAAANAHDKSKSQLFGLALLLRGDTLRNSFPLNYSECSFSSATTSERSHQSRGLRLSAQ